MHSPTLPSNLTNKAIGKYAERIADHFDIFSTSSAANLDALIDRLGGRVEISDSPESLHVSKGGDFVIFVPRHTSRRRDRFTIAHELGHYFLHYLLPAEDAEGSFGRGGRNRAETEANVFASCLLMPAAAFHREWDSYEGDVDLIAARFDVSPAAAEVRAMVLGLL